LPEFVVAGNGATYFLVTATDFNLNQSFAASILNDSVVATPDALPSTLTLQAVWPNPARARTSIAYQLPQAARVEAEVFDLMGRRVRTFGAAARAAGPNLLAWDGRDDRRDAVAAGIYLVRIRAAGAEVTARVLRM
jgi:hypothetical protein